MMCEQVNDELSAYLDGELPADARAAVESHLAGCVECQQAAAELKSIAAAIHDLPRLKAPAGLVSAVHEGVQKSPAPLLLIGGAPPINASGEVMQPRSMWGPVAFGIAAVLMLFALAFAVMPALSNNTNTTAMNGKKETNRYREADRDDRIAAAPEERRSATLAPGAPQSPAPATEPVASAAATGAPEVAEKAGTAKADSPGTFGAVSGEKKTPTLAEGSDKARLDFKNAKEELLEKPSAAPTRKAASDMEGRKLDERAKSTGSVAPGANANGALAERSVAVAPLQQEKQLDLKPRPRGIDAVTAEAKDAAKDGGQIGAPNGGGRRMTAIDGKTSAPSNAASAGAAPSAATPTPAPLPGVAPPSPPKPVAAAKPAPFAEPEPKLQKADALAKAAEEDAAPRPTPGPTELKKSAAPQQSNALAISKQQASDKSLAKKGEELRAGDNEENATNRNARNLEQEQSGTGSGKGAGRGQATGGLPSASIADKPKDGDFAGGKPGAPAPTAKRGKSVAALDQDDAPNSDRGRSEKLKQVNKDEAATLGGAGAGGGEGGPAKNAIQPALSFHTREPKLLFAKIEQLAKEHGGVAELNGANLRTQIPAGSRAAFLRKLSELQAQNGEAAKGNNDPKAKREATRSIAPAEAAAKELKPEENEKAADEVTFVVTVETREPPAAEAAKQPNE